MKLKCIDNQTRTFSKPAVWLNGQYSEWSCNNCFAKFGVHDLKVIKAVLKKHICKELMP